MVFAWIGSSRLLLAVETLVAPTSIAGTAIPTDVRPPQVSEPLFRAEPTVVSQPIPPALVIGRKVTLEPALLPQVSLPIETGLEFDASEVNSAATIAIAPREAMPDKIGRPRVARIADRGESESQRGSDTTASTSSDTALKSAVNDSGKSGIDREVVTLPSKTTVVLLPVQLGPITTRQIGDAEQTPQAGPAAELVSSAQAHAKITQKPVAPIHNHDQLLVGGMIDAGILAFDDGVASGAANSPSFAFVGTMINDSQTPFSRVSDVSVATRLPPPLPIVIDDQLIAADDTSGNSGKSGEDVNAVTPQMISNEHRNQRLPASPLDYTVPGGGLDIFKLAPSRFSVPLPMATSANASP